MRHVRWIAPVFALAMFGWIMGSVAKAEETKPTKGKIQGTAVDKKGNTVAGAKVTLYTLSGEAGKEKTNRIGEGATNASGEFTLMLPAGDYKIVVRKSTVGESTLKTTVAAGDEKTVTLTLTPPKAVGAPPRRRGGTGGGAGGSCQWGH